MSRPQYAYRLIVVYPDTPTYGMFWGSNGWDQDGYWHWPATRTYLSRRTADKRAALLRSYGCTVTVERSKPIEFAVVRPDAEEGTA